MCGLFHRFLNTWTIPRIPKENSIGSFPKHPRLHGTFGTIAL